MFNVREGGGVEPYGRGLLSTRCGVLVLRALLARGRNLPLINLDCVEWQPNFCYRTQNPEAFAETQPGPNADM